MPKDNRPETIVTVIILALCGFIIVLICALFLTIQNNQHGPRFQEPNIRGPRREQQNTKRIRNSLVPVSFDNSNINHL